MPRRVERLRNESRISRTPSDLLSDLHVYILPQDKWIPFRRLARITVAEETVSAGFVRVLPNVTLVDLRKELMGQLGDDVPEHYVFIKCVGRNFTQVKPHQEQIVKVKNFLPPQADEPEIHIMELSDEILRYAPSLSNLLASDTELSESFGPSRLTRHETYARAENLRSWAEANEGKWEGGGSASVKGDTSSRKSSIKTTDHYSLDDNIIIHWQSQEGDEEIEATEMRDRGDGMSDNRERRRAVGDGTEEEGSTQTSEEDEEGTVVRRSRKNEEKRGNGKKGVGRSGDGDDDDAGRSKGKSKRRGETESDEKGMDERSEETGDESGNNRAVLLKTNSKNQMKKRYKGNRKEAADGNSEEYSDEDERTGGKTKRSKDLKARRVSGRGVGKSDVEGEGEGGDVKDGRSDDVNERGKVEELGEQRVKVQEKEGDHGNANDLAQPNENRDVNEEDREGEKRRRSVGGTDGEAEKGHTGGEAGKGHRGGEAQNRHAGGEAEKGHTGGKAELGQTGGEAEKDHIAGEAGKGHTGGEAEKGHIGGEAEKGHIAGEAKKGQTGGEAEKGQTGGEAGMGQNERNSNDDVGGESEKQADVDHDGMEERPAKVRALRKSDVDMVQINGLDVKTRFGDSETDKDEQMGLKGQIGSRDIDRNDTGNSEREGAENSAGSVDESNVGRNIYARAENGDMVRIRLTAGGTSTSGGDRDDSNHRERANRKEGKDVDNYNIKGESFEITFDGKGGNLDGVDQKDDARTKQGKRKHETTHSTSKEPSGGKGRKLETKAGGDGGGKGRSGEVGVAEGKVGVAERGRARARRRNTKGLVTDSEGDADGSGQSRRNRVLKSTKFASTQKLTRSVSASRVSDLGSYAENLAGDKDSGPKVKRSASEERLGYDPWLYAPHKWYYARKARREARLKALEAKKQDRLDNVDSAGVPRPNVEILSLDGSLAGPLASLQEGVISGFQVNSDDVDETSENPLAASRDHLTLTYELEVDEQGSRLKPLGRAPGDGKGAWESEVEDGESPGLRAEADGEDTAVTDDHEGAHRRKKGRKNNRKKNQDQATEGMISGHLAQVLKEKAEAEEMRQKLFTQAKELHDEILRVKEKRREKWYRQYNDSRKVGTQLEERQAGYRNELDSLHRKIIGSIIRRQPLVTGVRDEPSRKANYKISIIRLRHEIEDLRRRVEAMDIKVETEVRLRNQAERELKTLRQEVSRKKANMALSRSKASFLRAATNFPTDLLVRM